MPGLSGIDRVRARDRFAFALGTDGSVYAWGDNTYGQLGIGSTAEAGTPVLVAALTGVKDVQAGGSHALALKQDGTVWSWGQNLMRELGASHDAGDRLAPVQVAGLTDIVAIAAGDLHAMALRSDGTVLIWGNNEYGQLGLGASHASQATPVALPGVSGVAKIFAGSIQGMTIGSDGSVHAWGDNDSGKLGDGSAVERSTPVAVPAFAGARSLDLGFSFTVIVGADGVASSVGENAFGRLGDGTVVNRLQPVKVLNLSGS